MAASLPGEGIWDPEVVELATILRGLQISAGMRINKLILESDCLFMIQECMSNTTSYTKLGSLVIEIKTLQETYEDCQLQHVLP